MTLFLSIAASKRQRAHSEIQTMTLSVGEVALTLRIGVTRSSE